jgi:hypothetical protein
VIPYSACIFFSRVSHHGRSCCSLHRLLLLLPSSLNGVQEALPSPRRAPRMRCSRFGSRSLHRLRGQARKNDPQDIYGPYPWEQPLDRTTDIGKSPSIPWLFPFFFANRSVVCFQMLLWEAIGSFYYVLARFVLDT